MSKRKRVIQVVEGWCNTERDEPLWLLIYSGYYETSVYENKTGKSDKKVRVTVEEI